MEVLIIGKEAKDVGILIDSVKRITKSMQVHVKQFLRNS